MRRAAEKLLPSLDVGRDSGVLIFNKVEKPFVDTV
jgi:hypothetical protein